MGNFREVHILDEIWGWRVRGSSVTFRDAKDRLWRVGADTVLGIPIDKWLWEHWAFDRHHKPNWYFEFELKPGQVHEWLCENRLMFGYHTDWWQERINPRAVREPVVMRRPINSHHHPARLTTSNPFGISIISGSAI